MRRVERPVACSLMRRGHFRRSRILLNEPEAAEEGFVAFAEKKEKGTTAGGGGEDSLIVAFNRRWSRGIGRVMNRQNQTLEYVGNIGLEDGLRDGGAVAEPKFLFVLCSVVRFGPNDAGERLNLRLGEDGVGLGEPLSIVAEMIGGRRLSLWSGRQSVFHPNGTTRRTAKRIVKSEGRPSPTNELAPSGPASKIRMWVPTR